MRLFAAALVSAGLIASCGYFASCGLARAEKPAEGPKAPFGLWRVADGTAVIEIKRCGRALCGYIAAAPAPGPGEKSAVGNKILLDLRFDGAVWRGPIYNLDDGKTYKGEISVADETHLKIRGCLPDSGLCGGETWKREPPNPSPR
jgi:uncharacterized protein (DUF2147 family)